MRKGKHSFGQRFSKENLITLKIKLRVEYIRENLGNEETYSVFVVNGVVRELQ